MKLGQQLTLLFDSAGSNALAVIIIKSSGTPRYPDGLPLYAYHNKNRPNFHEITAPTRLI